MHGTCNIAIKRLQNGYVLRMTDPEIVKENENRARQKDGSMSGRWRDPEVEFVFDDRDEILKFLNDNIDKALPMDEYSSSFDKAVKEATSDNEETD